MAPVSLAASLPRRALATRPHAHDATLCAPHTPWHTMHNCDGVSHSQTAHDRLQRIDDRLQETADVALMPDDVLQMT